MLNQTFNNSSEKTDFATKLTNWIGTPQSLLIHTIIFIGALSLVFLGFNSEQILLVLTTLVSLEAIYLSILIQMSVNRASKSLSAVEEDIDEIQEDVEDIQEDVQGLEEDVEDITEDIDEIQEEDKKEEKGDKVQQKTLDDIEKYLKNLIIEIETLKKVKK